MRFRRVGRWRRLRGALSVRYVLVPVESLTREQEVLVVTARARGAPYLRADGVVVEWRAR